jgi:uncharacterized protein
VSRLMRLFCVFGLASGLTFLISGPAAADTTPQTLPFSQSWTNTGLITANDNWSGVAGIIGYRGDDLTTVTATDPQTITADGSATPVNVIANQTNPNTLTTGGIAEFDTLANPTVALQGSGTADAPHLVITLDTTGQSSIGVQYNVRDIDGSADNAVQAVALQYRVGASGSYTNISAGFISDATTGPNLATAVTPVSVTLPPAADNQPVVQLRVMTTNAVGNDEWVGIDDLSITAGAAGTPQLSVNDVSHNEGNAGTTTYSFMVSLSQPAGAGGVTFDIATADGTASSASDYVARSLTGQTIAQGQSSYQFDVTVNGDTTFEPNETFFVNVTNVTGATVSDGQGQGTITNDDAPTLTPIHDIQGSAHISPLNTTTVSTSGIVTARATNGFWIQDPNPDADDATSEGIFVFTNSVPSVSVGDAVTVTGTVTEFRPGGAATANLTTTELGSPSVSVNSSGNPLPAPVVIGLGGRMPPTSVIEDDAGGDVETGGTFDPATDAIDFYESLEGMRVQVDNPVSVGPTNSFNEQPVLPDNGSWASVRTARGGILVRSTDFNPERVIIDDAVTAGSVPTGLNVGDTFNGSAIGVLDYNFGNFMLELTSPLVRVDGGLTKETTATPAANEVSVATFNVENLDPVRGGARFGQVASIIVNNLKSPDVVGLEEIQDNNGNTDDGTVNADTTMNTIVSAITTAGGPTYAYRYISPVNDQDGGEPGGNIRQVFLFRTDRGLSFVDKPGATSTTANTVGAGGLQYSPGRIDPTNAAFNASRKPLAAEFMFGGTKLYLIVNHFNSKGGDNPLFGHIQPPVLSSETQRNQQAQIVNDFVDSILAQDSTASIVVLGDLNDYQFSNPLSILKGGVLTDLIEGLPQNERYGYDFEGNGQALDHILVSGHIAVRPYSYDIVHVNSEFADQESDHDPEVVRFDPTAQPTAIVVGSFSARAGHGGVQVRWRTASQAGLLGFDVYRTVKGHKMRVNRALIRATGSLGGHQYSWRDRTGRTGVRYWLRLTYKNGSHMWRGPVRAA